MAKLTLDDLGGSLANETTVTSTINDNSALIETAMENTLSRDGTDPNQMDANLDMNNHDIINARNIFASDFYLDGNLLAPDVVSVDLPDFGQFLDTTQFTSSGTWDYESSGEWSHVWITVWGAGGGGGNALAGGSTAQGGGGGSYATIIVPRAYIFEDLVVTIGAAGSGASASSSDGGSAGGTTLVLSTTGSKELIGAAGGDGGDGSVGSGASASAWARSEYYLNYWNEILHSGANPTAANTDGADSIFAGASGAGSINTAGNSNSGGESLSFVTGDAGDWSFAGGPTATVLVGGGAAGVDAQGGGDGGAGFAIISTFR